MKNSEKSAQDAFAQIYKDKLMPCQVESLIKILLDKEVFTLEEWNKKIKEVLEKNYPGLMP